MGIVVGNFHHFKKTIELKFSKYSSEEIIELLQEKNIPCAKINTMLDVINDEENFTLNLLSKEYKKGVGEFVVSNGGITFKDFKQKEIIFIAVENNKVCSFVSFSPYEICDNTKLHNNFFICTLQATHPKHRRKGYISILTKKAEQKIYKTNKNVSFIGFSNNYGIQIDKKSKTIAYKIIHQFTSVRIPSCYFSSLYSENISFAEIKAPLNKINIFNDTTQKKIATVIYSKNKYTIDIYNILYYETNIDKKNIFTYLSQFAREQKK